MNLFFEAATLRQIEANREPRPQFFLHQDVGGGAISHNNLAMIPRGDEKIYPEI